MDINGSNSHSHENQSSRGSKNVNKEKKSTKKDVCDSTFVNHGTGVSALLLQALLSSSEISWHERRRAWVGDRSQRSERMHREPIMSWTTTYEDLLLLTEPFHERIPLAEMVDFLVDIWHEEGLYD